MSLAGEPLNILLLTGISNGNIFFMKMKQDVIVYSNINNKFAFTNLTYELNKKKKKRKLSITRKLKKKIKIQLGLYRISALFMELAITVLLPPSRSDLV